MATIRYLVQDVKTSIEFYTKHLGFELVEQMGPAFAIVAKDDLNIWLSGPQSSAARSMPDGRKPEPGGWNRFVIEVDDIETLVASMKTSGISFRNEIITGPGGKQILAEDPLVTRSRFLNLLNNRKWKMTSTCHRKFENWAFGPDLPNLSPNSNAS